MSIRGRWCLVVVMAAIALVGFMPRALLTDAATPARALVVSIETAPTFPTSCLDATCGKGTPAPSTPVLTIAALAAIASAMLCAAAGLVTRRFRRNVSALPSGNVAFVFHPPQFS